MFSVAKGEIVTLAELNYIAAEANRALTPQDMSRTWDLRHDSTGGYTPGLMTGAFSFTDPASAAAERWATLDELNRVWQCLWDIPAGSTGNGSWAVSAAAKTRVDNYWDPGGTGATIDTGYANEKIIASPGPNCFLEAPGVVLGTNIKCFSSCRALYTQEQPAFDIVTGVLSQARTLYGDDLSHDYAGRVVHTFNFEDLASAGLYGYFEIEFTRVSGSDDVNFGAGEAGLELASSSGGAVGGTETWLQEGNKFYMWFGTSAVRGEPWMIVSAGTYITGEQRFEAWVDTAGWVWSQSTWRGGFATTITPSTDGTTALENVLHPRNESVRIALHDSLVNDPHLADDDILDFDSLDALLSDPSIAPFPVGQRPVDLDIRHRLDFSTLGTVERLDRYPVTDASPSDARPLLLDDFNNRLIDCPISIYSLPAWSDVTLREGTQWFLDLDPLDPALLQRLNRMLLEDAYPTQLNRIPTGKVAPEDEILVLELADPVGVANFDGEMLVKGHMTSVDSAVIIYLADALPQWSYQTYLDLYMPNGSRGISGPRGLARWENPAGVESSWFYPALTPAPTMWPVFHRKHFGRLYPSTNTGERADVHTSGYAPYWDSDKLHGWLVQPPDPTPIQPGEHSFNATGPFIRVGSVADGLRYECNYRNRSLTLYASRFDYPDPDNPASYEVMKSHGTLVFPDDFTAMGLTPLDYEGGSIYITLANLTATAKTFQSVLSVFTPNGTESTGEPPRPEPVFFPTQQTSQVLAYSVPEYRFGPTWLAKLSIPIPKRGYLIRDILIQRMPVLNASGIYAPPTSPQSAIVKLGIMAGAGVIGGALNGVYPGDWVPFQDVTIGAGVQEVRTTVMWPVLEGVPIAYYVLADDTTEQFAIFAAVEFQPLANNSLASPGIFCGYPFLSNTWGWHQNFANSSNPTGPHRYNSNDIIPPASARALFELYNFLVTVP